MERHFNIQVGKPCEFYNPDPIVNEGQWVEIYGNMEWVYNYNAIMDIAKHIQGFNRDSFSTFFQKVDWVGEKVLPQKPVELPIQDSNPIALICNSCAGPFDTDFINELYKCKYCGTLWKKGKE